MNLLVAQAQQIEAPEINYGAIAPMLIVLGAACISVLLEALLPKHQRWAVQLVLTLVTLVGAVGDPEKKTAIGDLSKREIAVLAPLVVIVLALGFYPQPVLDVITPSVGATLTEVGVTDPVSVQEGK